MTREREINERKLSMTELDYEICNIIGANKFPMMPHNVEQAMRHIADWQKKQLVSTTINAHVVVTANVVSDKNRLQRVVTLVVDDNPSAPTIQAGKDIKIAILKGE